MFWRLDQWVFFFWCMEFYWVLVILTTVLKKVACTSLKSNQKNAKKKPHTKKLFGKSDALFSFAIFVASSKGLLMSKVDANKLRDFQVFFCCINFCRNQSCPGKNVKKSVAFRKTSIFSIWKCPPPPLSQLRVSMKKCWNQPKFCTNLQKL